jgi:hypothetical protein
MKAEMSGVQTVALAKLVKETAAREASKLVPAGEHAVDFTVRVTGKITKGEDYEQPIVEKADPWTLLAAALSHLNGVTVDSIVREALTAPADLVDSLKKQAADAVAAVKGPTMTKCNGKVTTKLAAELV